MSDTQLDGPSKQTKRCIIDDSQRSKVDEDSACFIFQDDSRFRVPLVILNKYPKSLLSLVFQNSENYIKDEDAYYIDSPPLSICQLVKFMRNKITLDSMSINEVCDMQDTIEHFFGDEVTDSILKIEDFCYESFKNLLKEQNCELTREFEFGYTHDYELVIHSLFTEEKVDRFLEYSKLFNRYNIAKVSLKFDFSEDIPYEYIYPSNLHEIFPKLKSYRLFPSYYPIQKEIQITSSNIHYSVLYKQYKRLYYIRNDYDKLKKYQEKYPEIEEDPIYDHYIHLYPIQNKNANSQDEKINTDRDILYDNNNNEYIFIEPEVKPDLYIESLSTYSKEYNDKQIELENKGIKNNNEKCDELFSFSYLDRNNVFDIEHPIISFIINLFKYYSFTDTQYKLQINIPPFLNELNNGLLDTMQIINILNFIHPQSYPDYIQLFKDIITTHVFPNLTTILFNFDSVTSDDIILMNNILLLIRREHFPKLSIYDLYTNSCDMCTQIVRNMINLLFPVSFLDLIDIIIINEKRSIFISYINEDIVNNLLSSNKNHNIHIQSI
ncbi:hypothetical protein WA158_000736 [Blastocystis sp. Blastoise]